MAVRALTDGRKEANAARRAPVLSEADEKLLSNAPP